MKSAFLLSKGLLCLYDKQNNTWFLVDMEFLFSCLTRAVMLNTPREIPYLRAPMYYSPCGQRVEKIAKKLHYKKYQAPVVRRVEKAIH